MKNIIPAEVVENKIFLLRKRKVMLDAHLAELYGVSTKVLNQAVKRNRARFPFVTLKQGGNIKYLPYVFTEQGVAMLSS